MNDSTENCDECEGTGHVDWELGFEEVCDCCDGTGVNPFKGAQPK
jgi:hypothetical protein